jgi:hypothetical protein
MRMQSPVNRSRVIDWVALAVTGAILLGFFLAFERYLAGSWRHVGAALLAVAVFVGGATVLDLILRRTGRAAQGALLPDRFLFVLPILGAGAGAAYGLVQSARVTSMPIAVGLAWGIVVAVSSFRQAQRMRRTTADAPAT